ncbi:CHASE domain-containing protein [Phormidium sp. CCY1219]|uniref:CHASE domain-containing protein n=1 Tax=Phormidium sp. CCY1219 TaxID=2886104 RepID=UPI002D1E595F|nr:CHASE domain-containing protein [Phormidium sp. CCY1219]MEB3829555.1 CHASE domain-containing protein [Phormidium sp. CCY1219]
MPGRNYPYLPVAFSAIVGVGLTAIATVMVWKSEVAKTQETLGRRLENLTVALQSSIDKYVQTTMALGAFYDASDRISRQDFKQFAQPFLDNYPGIHGMAWVIPVQKNQRWSYERAMRLSGLPNFQIKARDEAGKFVVAPDKEVYFPITYGEPTPIYKSIFGFNLASDPHYISALEKARDTGAIAATERVILAIQAGGLALYRPVYREDRPTDTVEERQENFQGMVYTIYKLSQMVQESLKGINLERLDFYLLDESAADENRFLIFYDSKTGQIIDNYSSEKPTEKLRGSLCPSLTHCTRTIQVADRQWIVLLVPQPGFARTQLPTLATLAIGLLLTSTLGIYLWMSIRRTVDLEAAMEKLQKTQAQLVQAEKMSSIGQLVAGVAHEINNPVSFIYGNISHADEYSRDLLELLQLYQQHYPEPVSEIQDQAEAIDLDFIIEDLPKTLSSMQVGADRIQQIVLSLRNFSRMDEAQMKKVDIHEGIESTLTILKHRLKETAGHPRIKLIKDYGNLPLVECSPGQLNQVFMNLMANAIDALEEVSTKKLGADYVPTLTLRTEVVEPGHTFRKSHSISGSNPTEVTVETQAVVIRIGDNGSGIDRKTIEQIFLPFFTTKPIGKGTGLGLSISYQIIVEKHHGILQCFSKPGKGTEFYIELPIAQPIQIA